jgi:DnaJ family protein C protein 3
MGSSASNTAMANLKQCLHYDPDSKPCLSAHRLVKSFNKQFNKLDELMAAEDWRGIITFILGPAAKEATLSAPGSGFLATFEGVVEPDAVPSVTVAIPPPKKASPRRAAILRALCRAHVQLRQARAGELWCDELLRMVGNEKDIDALLGKGEALLVREEWEEAVRAFERAWEASGGGNREVCIIPFPWSRGLTLENKLDPRAAVQGAAPTKTVETERLLQGAWRFTGCRRKDD